MHENSTALERAFELARSGRYATVELIKKQLHKEGYEHRQVLGPALSAQLRSLIRAARDVTRSGT
jgi:hypothetical protein